MAPEEIGTMQLYQALQIIESWLPLENRKYTVEP